MLDDKQSGCLQDGAGGFYSLTFQHVKEDVKIFLTEFSRTHCVAQFLILTEVKVWPSTINDFLGWKA